MDLVHTQERDRLLAFLRRLLRRTSLGGRTLPGLAHTEEAGAPILVLDNAVAAEVLAIPALHDAEPALADAALNLVLAAGPGERGAVPDSIANRVEIGRHDPRDLLVTTPWHVFTGDLFAGVLRQALRGEGEGQEVRHTGNLVRLRPGGFGPAALPARLGLRPGSLDVEAAITAAGVEREGEGVLMFHESALRLRPIPGLGWTVAAGTIRYEYRVGPADPVLRLSVTLRAAPGLALRDARVSTALDDLSLLSPPMRAVAVARDGNPPEVQRKDWDGLSTLAEGPLDTLHLWAPVPEAEEGALGIHLRPRATAGVHSARLQARDGLPHWLVIRHRIGAVPAGGTVTVREDRVLSRGPWPAALDRAAAVFQSALGEMRDPGVATGTGPALAAVAAAVLLSPAWAAPPPPERRGRWQAWLERQLDALPETAAPLDLALATVAAEALLRATGRATDGTRLDRLAERLLAASPGDGPLARGARLLALARVAIARPAPRMTEALAAALREVPSAGWAEVPTRPLAMLMRGARAAALAPLEPDEVEAAEGLADRLLEVLSARLLPRGDGLEVAARPGIDAGDALSQAATLLAVLSPDAAALSVSAAAA
ncbi:hypothetical protein [Muricoccus radiodurans]|uniref:hypothetical protein n=1 Tax=Muricoccus radiodurans TaxID=2231721 RepID=UPI003CF23DFB